MFVCSVAKKEKILQMEVTKLEKLLCQRNEMLCGLRGSHEYLLTTNGQLQCVVVYNFVIGECTGSDGLLRLGRERSRRRREKLVSLRMLLGAGQEEDGMTKLRYCDAAGMNEVDATAEKCGVLKDILLGLVDKHAGLEQRCMGLEEQTSRETVALRAKEERLNEGMRTERRTTLAVAVSYVLFGLVRCTLHLLLEDIRSTQWNFEVIGLWKRCRPSILYLNQLLQFIAE